MTYKKDGVLRETQEFPKGYFNEEDTGSQIVASPEPIDVSRVCTEKDCRRSADEACFLHRCGRPGAGA